MACAFLASVTSFLTFSRKIRAGRAYYCLSPAATIRLESIMAHPSPCPSLDQLENVMRGNTPLSEVERISAHVETCRKCEETLQSLHSEDSIAEDVRAGARDVDIPVDPGLDQANSRRFGEARNGKKLEIL